MTYKTTRRNRLAHAIANWVLNHLATVEYRAFLTVVYARGKQSLDEELGLDTPSGTP